MNLRDVSNTFTGGLGADVIDVGAAETTGDVLRCASSYLGSL
jgi:hypothetical protein